MILRRQTTKQPPKAPFWFWVAALYFVAGAFEVPLSGRDPSLEGSYSESTGLDRYVRYAIALLSLIPLFSRIEDTISTATKSAPILLLLLFQFAMIPRAADPAWSLLQLTAFMCTVVAVVGAIQSLGPGQTLEALAYVFGWIALTSLVLVVVDPQLGITQVGDRYGTGAAGDWRGIFGHKNELGHACGLGFAVLACYGKRFIKSRFLLLAFALSSAICVVGSRSAAGLVIAASLVAFHFGVLRPVGPLRLASVSVAAFGGLCFLFYQDEILSFVFERLGRNATLSDRTLIWTLAPRLIEQSGALGSGAFFSFSTDFKNFVAGMFKVPYLHNSFLDLLVNNGWFGSAALMAVLLHTLMRALVLQADSEEAHCRNAMVLMLVGCFISATVESFAAANSGFIAVVELSCVFGLYSLPRSTAYKSLQSTKNRLRVG